MKYHFSHRNAVDADFVVNVDWLALNCYRTSDDFEPSVFTIRDKSGGNKYFADSCSVYLNDECFARLCYNSRSSIIDIRIVQVRIENAFLYNERIVDLLQMFFADMRLKFHNISRLDVAGDFQRLIDYEEPRRLIEELTAGVVVTNNRSKFFVGGTCDKAIEYEYLKIGSRTSAACAYMYNKTKEMEEGKTKGYIIDTWKGAGFDLSRDVWRIEVSITDSQYTLRHDDEIVFSMSEIWQLFDKDILPLLYSVLVRKHFTFKRVCRLANKSRWPDVNLLVGSVVKCVRVYKEYANSLNGWQRLLRGRISKMIATHDYDDEKLGDALRAIEFDLSMRMVKNRAALSDAI